VPPVCARRHLARADDAKSAAALRGSMQTRGPSYETDPVHLDLSPEPVTQPQR
jgi:hypothetical protein